MRVMVSIAFLLFRIPNHCKFLLIMKLLRYRVPAPKVTNMLHTAAMVITRCIYIIVLPHCHTLITTVLKFDKLVSLILHLCTQGTRVYYQHYNNYILAKYAT